ncbi:MAG: PAS domain-containing hybrid sensor histidine kinase/response regulator [Calditrichaeota bacterium]|nr:MAG: PAS domain-containing hybrid sensor histidine kinase/response regulator [Calditrichota bacterium]
MSGPSLDIYLLFIIATGVLFFLGITIIVIILRSQQKLLQAERDRLQVIQESEAKYRRFFEEDLTGDFIISPSGNILSCNPAFAFIFGFSSVEEVYHFNYSSFFPDPSKYKSFLKLVETRKKLEYHEVELRRRDGKPLFIIENIIGEFDEEGNLIEIRGYIFDNTERKHLEQQLLQAQKMQSIGTLAGGIAHDFNNILSIIMGHSSLLEADTINVPHLHASAEAISKAAERGAQLVDQILTFARKADIVFESVNVNTVIEELYQLISGTFPKTIIVILKLSPHLPRIRGDQNQLHQAFLNICVNARDAMPEGGTLTIYTGIVSTQKIKAKYPDARDCEYVKISFSDTGIGMDENTRKQLFEPFFTTKVRGRGTGLGLAVVYGIVSSHYGYVEVESEPGKGTTFHFYFPSYKEKSIPDRVEHIQHPIKGNETILVVEDEDMLVDLLSTVFRANGYNILIARDGKEAVQVYQEHQDKIDLVFTDSGLPKMSGWEAFLEIQKINPDVHVVFASGFFEPNQKKMLQEHGVTDFVYKPYSPQSVVQKIREVLDRIAKETH